MKKISVIVPIYNVEKYLHKCIDSIIKQTYKNLEIILVDDGSQDNSPKICDEYAQKDKRIKVIHKKNEGVAEARNVGLVNSTGEYINFVDSDDYIDESMCETLLNIALKENSDIVVSNYIEVMADDEKVIKNSKLKKDIVNMTNKEALKEMYIESGIGFVVPWGKLYSRKLFENIKYPKGKIHEDEFTTYKLIFKANKITYLNEVMYYYFQREDSIMGKRISLKNLTAVEALEEREVFLYKNGLQELVPYNERALFFNCILLYNSFKYQNQKEESIIFKNKLKALYKKILNQKNLSLIKKMKYTIACFFPELYSMIYKNKRVRD